MCVCGCWSKGDSHRLHHDERAVQHGVGRQQHEAVALQPDQGVEAWGWWGGCGVDVCGAVSSSNDCFNRTIKTDRTDQPRTLRLCKGGRDDEEQEGQEQGQDGCCMQHRQAARAAKGEC